MKRGLKTSQGNFESTKWYCEVYLYFNMVEKFSVKGMERYAEATLLQISSLLTAEISRLTFFLVTNSADSHRIEGMGIQNGRSTNCEQWGHAVKEGATDGIEGGWGGQCFP